jgi:hypothetical protein
MKFSAINPQLRVAANRNKQFKTNTRKKKLKNENKLQKRNMNINLIFGLMWLFGFLSEF